MTFASATPSEREWRLSFYDRYNEWDAFRLGSHDASQTPVRIVDIFAHDNQVSSKNLPWLTIPVSRSLERI